MKAPAVYRFVCPDGRSYVGAATDIRKRDVHGIARTNPWLKMAFERYPPDTFTYEILERLPPGCAIGQLREAEQRHIERLRSWAPEPGFNIYPAVWNTAMDQESWRRVSAGPISRDACDGNEAVTASDLTGRTDVTKNN
jgi:hypothetical protein